MSLLEWMKYTACDGCGCEFTFRNPIGHLSGCSALHEPATLSLVLGLRGKSTAEILCADLLSFIKRHFFYTVEMNVLAGFNKIFLM
uniref:Uncharacterized protein n=1 Tax=Anguilla anguilla TaxID=7936 RepID=A0A0E9X3P9_ANGAN